MDIRNKPEVKLPKTAMDWLKAGRPFKQGTVVTETEPGKFVPVQEPAVATSEQPQQASGDTTLNAGLPTEFANVDILGPIQAQAEAEQPAPEETKPEAGSKVKQFCVHCGWDQDKPDPDATDELDKLNFVQAVLGQIPFKKIYGLLGGRLKLTFRTLSSTESDMTFTQVAFDVANGAMLDENQYFRTIMDYRLCLGLAEVNNGTETTELPDSADAWVVDALPTKATRLTHIVPFIYSNVLKLEPVRRAAAACYYRFQRLVENFESHLDDPNFWQAIEK